MQFSSLASTSIVNDFHRLSRADDSFDGSFEICTVSKLVSKHSVDGVPAEFCLAANQDSEAGFAFSIINFHHNKL